MAVRFCTEATVAVLCCTEVTCTVRRAVNLKLLCKNEIKFSYPLFHLYQIKYKSRYFKSIVGLPVLFKTPWKEIGNSFRYFLQGISVSSYDLKTFRKPERSLEMKKRNEFSRQRMVPTISRNGIEKKKIQRNTIYSISFM